MKWIFVLLLSSTISGLYAQNLVYDPGFPVGGGATSGIFRMLSQADGRVIIGGTFPAYNGLPGRGLVRIWPNGQRDAAFNIGAGVSNRVQELAAGPNGRIYVGGLFTSFNGTTVGDFVCLDSNGTIDPSFIAGTGFNNEVTALAVYPNGDIVVGGFFNQYKGQSVTQPVRIFANGQRDTTFNLGGAGTFGIIDAICIQPDNKILVAGTITQYNGQAAGRLIRLNPNGSRDSTFDLNLTFSHPINEIALLPDGRILVGGTFSSVNAIPMNRIARILPNGQPDPGFTPGTGFNATVRTVQVTGEGQIAVGGDFTSFNGIATNRVAVLDTNGNLAYGTGSCATSNGTIYAIVSKADQSLVVGGVFSQMGSATAQRIARLTQASSLNSASIPSITASSTTSCSGQRITLNLNSGNLNGASNWHWYSGSCGGTAVGTSTSIFVTPVATTTYYVRGEGSCVAPGPCDSITITVQDSSAPVPVIANLPTIRIGCGLMINPAFADDNCIGTIPGVANRSLTFTEPGTFNVIWTYTDSAGNSSSQSQTVIVDTVDTRIIFNPSTNTLSSLHPNAAYQWVRCDLGYQPLINGTFADYSTTTNGEYAVIITENGCIDTSACLSLVFLSVNEHASPEIRLYPNPAIDKVSVVLHQTTELTLFDTQAKLVFHIILEAGNHDLQLPALRSGLYYWRIQDVSKQSFRFKSQLLMTE